MRSLIRVSLLTLIAFASLNLAVLRAAEIPMAEVEGQPLAANVARLVDALKMLGAPLSDELTAKLRAAGDRRDDGELQKLLDAHAALAVQINPESRVKVLRGTGPVRLQQAGFTPLLVKVINEGVITSTLRVTSPQSGAVYSGESLGSLGRQGQTQLKSDLGKQAGAERFLQLEMFASPPMTDELSGLGVEYAILLAYSLESGRREATVGFDIGQGTQDLGFRGATPLLFDIRPTHAVRLNIRDHDNRPTTARLVFRDRAGHCYPPQAKRLSPDFFFQEQVYRHDGETVMLPPGTLAMEASRGPEYKVIRREVTIDDDGPTTLDIRLERWINLAEHGYYSGDHHIHAAGCAHYTHPTEGVPPVDMFRQVKGEGLNVGCVLTWGPCYLYQRQFFAPVAHQLSEPLTVVKYDIEVSGFGSQALGHVCLLNLTDQTYPGSEGTETKGWPTWTTPVMRWTKAQGGYTGYAHSASGLHIEPAKAAARLLELLDSNQDQLLTSEETAGRLLPEPFEAIDADNNKRLTLAECVASHERAAQQLPNLAIPEMNGAGAMEICVSTAHGVCDFISAMDTARIQEWNTWYHLMNCGFPLKASGETDFPCMSSTRVGQGRVYVQLGKVDAVKYPTWCEGLAKGRSYVSDGYAHAMRFDVAGQPSGGEVQLSEPGKVTVRASVAFAADTPQSVAHGLVIPATGTTKVGDTVVLYPQPGEKVDSSVRMIELVVNGRVVERQKVAADDRAHDLKFEIPIERSSWVALRQFPQLHTNPVNVIVGGKPIRVSRASALWCIGTIDQLWRNRAKNIAERERPAAEKAFQEAIVIYRRLAEEAGE